jgi:hypothetical protein
MAGSRKNQERVEVFYSYSHRDEGLREELQKHLSVLRRNGIIDDWHDRKISPGSEWGSEIDTHLNSAKIILLLVSPDFLASDYCYGIEMKRALERHEAKEACAIPVILRHCDWYGAPFAKLQALPRDAKPVTAWTDTDEAFTDIAKGISRAVGELMNPRGEGAAEIIDPWLSDKEKAPKGRAELRIIIPSQSNVGRHKLIVRNNGTAKADNVQLKKAQLRRSGFDVTPYVLGLEDPTSLGPGEEIMLEMVSADYADDVMISLTWSDKLGEQESQQRLSLKFY